MREQPLRRTTAQASGGGRELAIAERTQDPAQRCLAHRDPELLPDPHRQVFQSPAYEPMDRRHNVIVVYKVDRLTRSLTDFAKLVELFDEHGVSFVSVTQAFNTTTSMGRLTLNVLLSFAQFEREVTGERIRDKIAASKTKGIWMGGSSARLPGREPGPAH